LSVSSRESSPGAASLPLTVRYSAPESVALRSSLLGRVSFSLKANPAADVTVPLRQLFDPADELWIAAGEVRDVSRGPLRARVSSDLLFGSLSLPADAVLTGSTREAYLALVEFVREQGHPHFLRIWNHVTKINDESSGLERYRQFCLGRHDAFEALGYALRGDLPAASAVGSREGPAVVIYFIASRTPAVGIENPRQMSAFEYPEMYGPRSPSFSRASLKRFDEGSLLFVSGTASIIGHRSVHPDSVPLQLEETMRNIERVVHEGERLDGVEARGLERITAMKTYIRHEEHAPFIHEQLRRLTPHADLLFVEADICRSELLLEIEAIAAWNRA
jgi:chorismate lyase/3-hydroxybenzoate synthase